MNVGWNVARSGSSVPMSGMWPSTAPASTAPTSIRRANECARGRKSRVDAPGVSKITDSQRTAFRALASRLPWVISHPFGRPVVPEV